MQSLPEGEARRRRRERVIIFILIAVVGLLTYVETKVVRFGAGLPVSNTIITFILININMLLLLLLIFLVFRNLVKLLYDRKRGVMGAKLRTKLVMSFASLSLIPTILLFFFSGQFITASVAFWFNVPVEQSLQRSLEIGKEVYRRVEENNRFFVERIAYQIERRDLLREKNEEALEHYVQVVQRAFNLQAVEVYSADAQRLAFALSAELEYEPLDLIQADAVEQEIGEKSFSSRSQFVPAGEVVRTLACVPIDAEPNRASAVVAVATLIPASLSRDMADVSRGMDHYQQMKMVKKPIQISHMVTLSIVALLIIFCATWFGFYLAKTLTIPIQKLAEGTRRVAEGDLNFTIDRVGDDEMGTLVNAFNKMTRDLRTGKQQLEFSNQELRKRNREIEQRRLYMETVLRNVSTGVVSLDASGLFATMNKSAEKMLGLEAGLVLSRSYKKLLTPEYLALAEDLLEGIESSPGNSVERTVRLTIGHTARTFVVHATALKDDKARLMGTVIVFDDMTEAEKAQRMAAWREVARRIAHEVKNPLTPIKLSAQRLRRKYGDRIDGDRGVFMECTQTIIDQVDQIRDLVNEFSSFARLPAVKPDLSYLPEIVEDAVALYREAHPEIFFNVDAGPDIPQQMLDRAQMKRVMLNLIDNAIGAIEGQGTITVRLRLTPEHKAVRMEVIDTGCGIVPEDRAHLFEPYFSTKKGGMGLGLSIVSTVIEDHDGAIWVEDNHPQGTKFVVELPA